LDTIHPDNDGTITVMGDEYGCEWRRYNDAETKARYCLTDMRESKINLDMLEEVIKEHTGAREVKFIVDDNCYIDHDSVGTSAEAFASKDSLRNFLFNPESWLFIGNDKSIPPPNFYDVEFGIEYTHELGFVGNQLTYKFQSQPSERDLREAVYSLLDHAIHNRSYHFHFEESALDKNGVEHSSLEDINNGILKLFNTDYVEDKVTKKRNRIIKDMKEIRCFLRKL
jgi:hypothetical protein